MTFDHATPVAVAAVFVAQAASVSLDVNTIVLAVIGLAGTALTGYLALRTAALAVEAKENKVSMEKIHTAVNSSKTVLENKVDDLIKQNVELAKKVSTLEENKRGSELARAVASAPPMVVLPAVVAPVAPVVPVVIQAPVVAPPAATETIAAIASAVEVAASAPTRMGEAITELKAAAEETSVVAKEASIAADKTVNLVDKQVK